MESEAADLAAQLTALANRLLVTRTEEPSADTSIFIIQALPLFAKFKHLHRDASVASLESRAQATEARLDMDRAQLSLQNLMYEKQHFEREIQKCGEYDSQYQNIPLHSDAEFDELASNAGLIVPDEPHERMVARLNYELSERKRLDAEKKELAASKQKLTKINAEKKAALDVLDKQLEDFVVSAKDIQQKMAGLY